MILRQNAAFAELCNHKELQKRICTLQRYSSRRHAFFSTCGSNKNLRKKKLDLLVNLIWLLKYSLMFSHPQAKGNKRIYEKIIVTIANAGISDRIFNGFDKRCSHLFFGLRAY